jgi:2-C-methyl-D-erythritol 4-phosphate cytidylyltransferase
MAGVTGMSAAARLFALVPAAGRGQRIGGDLPKQYQRLGGRPMLAHSVGALLAEPRIEHVLVVVAADDDRVAEALRDLDPTRVAWTACGGASRAETVRNGLAELPAADADWVLVHDAARPCLAPAELGGLIDALREDPLGGLLALPLADTLKRAERTQAGTHVAGTLERAHLWRAATPQMFRAGRLRQALAAAPDLAKLTDESSALEAVGAAPRLVAGLATNIKVTLPDDWPLAEAILRGQGRI